MSPLLEKIIKGAWGAVTKKVTVIETDDQGDTEEVTKRQVRPGIKLGTWLIIGLALVYHFIGQPILNHHFPDFGFPPIDFGWLTGLFMGL